jgi:hypothetical protein
MRAKLTLTLDAPTSTLSLAKHPAGEARRAAASVTNRRVQAPAGAMLPPCACATPRRLQARDTHR